MMGMKISHVQGQKENLQYKLAEVNHDARTVAEIHIEKQNI